MSAVTKAMILAAGYGLRLKPLTDTIPKPLVEHNGRPMIENVIEKLISSGISDITVNTHHLSGKLNEYFASKKFSVPVHLIHEKEILGTGGGIKNASEYLHNSGNFLVHNVDVDSGIDLSELYEFHESKKPLATLCVKERETARPLLVDENKNLVGRIKDGGNELKLDTNPYFKTAFCGVYMLSDRVFSLFPPESEFDIVPFLLEMVSSGEKVICYDIGSAYWKDLGKPSDISI